MRIKNLISKEQRGKNKRIEATLEVLKKRLNVSEAEIKAEMGKKNVK